MPPRSRSHKKPLTIFALFPFLGLLIFGIFNYNLAPPEEFLNYENSNILLSLIRASFYFAAGVLFMVNLKKNSSWLIKRFELVACIIFVLASAAWTSHIDRLLIGSLHFVGGIIVAYIAALYFTQHQHQQNPYHFLALMFGSFAIGSLIASIAIPSFGTQYFEWEEVTRWRGLTTNANTLGLASLLAIWSSAAAYLTSDNKKLNILYITFIVSACINLWGSDSKTSLIVSLLSVSIIIIVNILASGSSTSKQKKFIYFTYAIVVASIFISLFFADKITPDQMAQSIGRSSDLSGRDTLWEDAIKTFSVHPIVGWSFDGRASAYDYIPQQVTHYHNGFLDLAVRGGIVGLILFLVFILKHLRNLIKLTNTNTRYYGPMLAILMGFLVHNMTEVSLASFDNIFWVLILFTYFIAERALRQQRIERLRHRKHKRAKVHHITSRIST